MFRKFIVIIASLLFAFSAFAQTQTPRQALIEMFSARDSKAFARHLPKVMQARLAALGNNGGPFAKSPADFPSSFGRKGDMHWFENGPVLLMGQDANSRVEVRVEKEDQQGDRCNMELSFSVNMSQQTPFDGNATRLLLTMVNEDNIWRLSEFGMTFKMKLDGSFIEAMTKQFGGMQSVTATTMTKSEPPQLRTISASELSPAETAALDVVRDLVAAETQYRSANPDSGFTCDSAAVNVGEVTGYRTMIVGCKGTPVANFKVTLTPVGMGAKGRRAFCADESGVIRYSDDGRGLSCLSENNRIQ